MEWCAATSFGIGLQGSASSSSTRCTRPPLGRQKGTHRSQDPVATSRPLVPIFQLLKQKLEREWLDELCRLLELEKSQLPVIWDADFLYGPKSHEGADTFALCEINVSSVYPFPQDAPA
jgi:hypothetical protein